MKAKAYFFAAAIAVLFAMSGCVSTPKTDVDSFEDYVMQTLETYSELVNAGNVNDWIELWDANGVQLPPGAPAFEGKSAIIDSISGAYAVVDFTEFKIVNEEVEVDGNLGFARGNYSYVGIPTDGSDSMLFEGKYLTIFKRQSDGTWKIYRDCFNSNK
jgi:ketosteroid isomerase-like protein